MARYIKANPKVARHLRLENDRNQVADGNYLLWQADMLAFGRLTDLPNILAQIGGISLQAHEAREEQDGTVIRKLPTATDPRFVEDVKVAEDTGEDDGTQEPTDVEGETQEQPETAKDDTGTANGEDTTAEIDTNTNEETEA